MRDATWVRVDGDDAGRLAVAKLSEKFPSWEPGRFATFTKANFENYYPARFQTKVQEVLAIEDRQEKRVAKSELLGEVLQWIKQDPDRARTELESSAAEVIVALRELADQLQ